MKLKEQYTLDNIVNRSAELVYAKVENFLTERDDFCHCEDCVLDLIAYTLNHVTPIYRTSLLAPLHPNKDIERKVEIEIGLALKAGVKKIKGNPHHDTMPSTDSVSNEV